MSINNPEVFGPDGPESGQDQPLQEPVTGSSPRQQDSQGPEIKIVSTDLGRRVPVGQLPYDPSALFYATEISRHGYQAMPSVESLEANPLGIQARLMVAQGALEHMIESAMSGSKESRERGGLLYGQARQEPLIAPSRFGSDGSFTDVTVQGQKPRLNVRVDLAIESEIAAGTFASLNLSPEAMQEIDALYQGMRDKTGMPAERLMQYFKVAYSEETPVGWFHSHPGHGVFLSHFDMRLQRDLMPYNSCAAVYDPRRNQGYIFMFVEGECVNGITRADRIDIDPQYQGLYSFSQTKKKIKVVRKISTKNNNPV